MIDWLKRSHIEPELELNGVVVPITLKRHRTAKRLTMRLAPDGSEVRITLPSWARSAEAIAFAHARTDWLAEQHAKVPQREAPGPGSVVQFRGRDLNVDWQETLPRKPTLNGNSLTIGGPRSGIETRIKRWLEKEALGQFEGDIADYTSAAALDTVPVGLSRAQRRWGSCSDGGAKGQKRIRLNWRLIQAPDHVRRSVAAHEVAHLIHFDHSPAFHALLRDIYEGDIKEADRWLKAHGRSLYANFG
ncbi:YgjP-like metallopeptidase domain-containing protein [uncultured Erythrobacter sp.]|uniref:M48 family metallopeptidase n=1 Tax=uncultured Erythrobacter sp. TaxID=263913 RepID=UPI002603EE46|nr:YgjP-like metallopeptidase domain-containing protein [uncultured Erythrobacter sp.]